MTSLLSFTAIQHQPEPNWVTPAWDEIFSSTGDAAEDRLSIPWP